ncbi:hypothetical protein EJ07DRAFT_177782 [Lizonia empirigonia]|nr:hypothetical protein EJ07DRAFT_177782 [Lizonia empirigonia]
MYFGSGYILDPTPELDMVPWFQILMVWLYPPRIQFSFHLRVHLNNTPKRYQNIQHGYYASSTIYSADSKHSKIYTGLYSRTLAKIPHFSGITSVEYEVLNAFILVPASELGMSGEYIFDWLKEYPNHGNDAAKRHQALPYRFPSHDSKQQAKEYDQDALEEHLISIDMCVQKISPNEKKGTEYTIIEAVGKMVFFTFYFRIKQPCLNVSDALDVVLQLKIMHTYI